ncbi:cysteine--tRNA ligase [Galliscardovia ingluviei]|uniref:Cysteine--tRNA ligase n=1 Tax=Galliscardovia ingluviei TaxID=1769422 RepID=A0A8J3EZP5_9BIFI|nr:cysteine--tRNA ligase [Galliscardovia ingluviei]GGI15139.1 cysteine--tRNA ligase [Galliscardovia ingluviei]
MTHTPQPLEMNSSVASQLRLYNTASHSVEQFVPLREGHVGMYVCGATVQSSPHIGHVRAAVAFDVVRRWLLRLGFDVTFVRNVTDIDDKILDKASAAGQQWWARAYYYEREFNTAYQTLGVLAPTVEPRATGHVPDMIALVQRLIERGHAYVVPDEHGNPSGNVYFDVPSWPRYGELTHQESGTRAALDDAARIAEQMGPSVDATGEDKYNPVDVADASSDKHNPRDFALWKAPKDTDPLDARWQTPFGTGRPGWHLECSAMSHRYLGDDFDIHGGGLDLRFPHHENETAQSRAAGWGFAHLWMHSAWVTAKGEKMSKSLGNGLSVPVVVAQCGTPWVLRYALASVQYRSMLEWSEQTLVEAKAAYERIMNFLDHATAAGVHFDENQVQAVRADELPEAFVAAMNDDINVSGALAQVFALVRQGNSVLAELDTAQASGQLQESETLRSTLAQLTLQVRAMLDTLGLDPYNSQWHVQQADNREYEALDTMVSALLEQRAQARAVKDFATADAIRDTLTQAGIIVEDSAAGSTWSIA